MPVIDDGRLRPATHARRFRPILDKIAPEVVDALRCGEPPVSLVSAV
jgi:hypothetical protein